MSAPEPERLRFLATRSSGEVSALWQCPPAAQAALVLAHGAGADMHHAFLEALAERLAARGIASFRFQFPYREAGRRRIDPRPILLASARAAVAAARARAGALPLFAGGKSMGGRMLSQAAAEEPLAGVRGLVFFGFPLHPAGKPGDERAEHLARVELPMLFLNGTRDRLAELDLLRPVCEKLAPRATLRVVEGADHGFHVLKRSGRSDADVLDDLADATRDWAEEHARC